MPRKTPSAPKPQLTVIRRQPAAIPAPPGHLGLVAAELWRSISSTYEFTDAASTQILAEACSALDRSERCRAAITEDGEVIRGRGGLLRPHPLLTAEIQSRALACRLLARLGLDLEPVRALGRPAVGLGVTLPTLRGG